MVIQRAIIATQYPKADVVTGILKANLLGRVCLRMTDGKQSQVVLGRLQAAYLPEAERKTLFSAQEY